MNGLEIALLVIAILAVIWCALWLFTIAPSRRKMSEEFLKTKYAHRGLHNEERVENSLSAFKAAVEAGYGIEFDVRAAKDGTLVIFHDPTLSRMTGAEGKVIEKTMEELRALRLNNTEDTLPTFDEVLSLVNGKVPLLVEIKDDVSAADTLKICERLKNYEGKYIVESFNPLLLKIVKKQLPNVYRGVLAQNFLRYPIYRSPVYYLLQTLRLNFLAKPDFIAYDKDLLFHPSLWAVKKIFRRPFFAWTIRSEEEEEKAYKDGFTAVIFEKYLAKKS